MNNIDILIIVFRAISLGALIALVATAANNSKSTQGSPPLTKQSINKTPETFHALKLVPSGLP